MNKIIITIDCDEAIQKIKEVLNEIDGETIAKIYNMVCTGTAIYIEDSLIEVKK